MRISIGSDHRGVRVKSNLVQLLTRQGHVVADEGAHDEQGVDYPDIASIVAAMRGRWVVSKRAR